MKITIKINYLIIAGIALLAWFLGGFFTWRAIPWYKTLNLPAITPSNYIFSLAWRLIFLLTTIAAIRVWNNFERGLRFWCIIALFVINTFLNIYWSYLFFGQHLIGPALIDAIFLEITILGLMYLIWPQSRFTVLLLTPYSGWVFFAILLNILIWQMN